MRSVSALLPFRSVVFRLTVLCTLLISFFMVAIYMILSRQLNLSLYNRIDDDLETEIVEYSGRYSEGVPALDREFQLEADSEGSERIFGALLGPAGEIIVSSDYSQWNIQTLKEQLVLPRKGESRLQTVELGEQAKKKARVITYRFEDENILLIAQSLSGDEALLHSHRQIFGISIIVMVIGTSFLVWFVMKRVMGGITDITKAAIAIGEGNISKRVSAGDRGEEIEHLALAFNEMLSKIEGLIRGLREVTDNIAHDLRSPLTRIRGAAETTLASDDLFDYKEMASNIIEECDRLVGMINTTLEISQADSGLLSIERKPIDIKGMIEDAYDLFLPAAEDAGITLKKAVPEDQNLTASGDRARLQRVLANLLDNALKHTPAGGEVTLGAQKHGNQIKVSVSDTGTGIRPEDLPRIWDRFYRGEESRSTLGNGLGLSFVQSVIRLHQGVIDAESVPGKGAVFTFSIPA